MPNPQSTQPSFSSSRRWLIRLNLLLGLLALTALLVMVNYLAGGHYARYRVDSSGAARLSPQTLRVLDWLTNKVSVTVFFNPAAEGDLYSLTTGLLAEYKLAKPENISVRTLDYTRFDSEARQLLSRLHLNGLDDKNFVVFESNGNAKICYANSFSGYDYSALLSGESRDVRRNSFRGEMLFTSAILAVTHPEALKTYFLTGHGEHNAAEKTNADGYGKFAAILKDELNTEWQPLSLAGTNTVPSDCQLLVIPGPRIASLLPNELEKIDNYLNNNSLNKRGGRLLLMLSNQYTNSGAESMLAKWGVELENDRVIEKDENWTLSPDGADFRAWGLAMHPMMEAIRSEGASLRMNAPRPFRVKKLTQAPGAPEVSVLATSSEKSVLERQPARPGSFRLVVAIEQGVIKDVKAPGTRILAVGDSTMFSNQRIEMDANHMFAAMALNWLMERPSYLLEGLTPRPIKEYKLFLTQSQRHTLELLFQLGLPGVILLIGGMVWLKRRR